MLSPRECARVSNDNIMYQLNSVVVRLLLPVAVQLRLQRHRISISYAAQAQFIVVQMQVNNTINVSQLSIPVWRCTIAQSQEPF